MIWSSFPQLDCSDIFCLDFIWYFLFLAFPNFVSSTTTEVTVGLGPWVRSERTNSGSVKKNSGSAITVQKIIGTGTAHEREGKNIPFVSRRVRQSSGPCPRDTGDWSSWVPWRGWGGGGGRHPGAPSSGTGRTCSSGSQYPRRPHLPTWIRAYIWQVKLSLLSSSADPTHWVQYE